MAPFTRPMKHPAASWCILVHPEVLRLQHRDSKSGISPRKSNGDGVRQNERKNAGSQCGECGWEVTMIRIGADVTTDKADQTQRGNEYMGRTREQGGEVAPCSVEEPKMASSMRGGLQGFQMPLRASTP